MKYTIHKDLLIDISGFENDQVSVISPKDYNSILYSTELTEMTDDKIEVGIKFIVRSTYSNEVLIIDNEPVKDLDLIVPEQEGIEGYFQVVHTLDKYLRSLATISVKLMARTHLMGCGCPICGGKIRYTTNDFIEKSKEFFGNKYDYSLTNFVDTKTKVLI